MAGGAIIGLLGGCSPLEILNGTVSRDRLTVVHDLPYGAGPLASNPRARMDVYRPSDRSGPLPVVVFFYGGSWQDGRRQDYAFVAAELARRGVIVVVPDYRVYPEVRFPSFLQDAAQAVSVAHASAPSWGGARNRVFVVGHSAGAWIAAMLALDPRWLADAGLDRQRVAGTVGISGPYDFLPIVRPDIKEVFAPAAADMRATQPVRFVDGHNRPMLLLTGDSDSTVQPRNTASLAAAIRAAGGPVRTKIYPGAGHIGTVTAFAPLFRDGVLGRGPSVLDDVAGFVDEPALAVA